MKSLSLIPVLAMVALITGCSSDSANGDPAPIVEQYLQAKVEANRDKLRDLLCAEQEVNLDREAQSFSSVKAKLENVSCQRDGDADTVTCTGAIIADYNGENTPFPLGKYKVTLEDGQWKWCGETS